MAALVTDAYLEALAGQNLQWSQSIEVVQGGVPTGITFPVESIGLTVDRTNSQRWTGEIVVDPSAPGAIAYDMGGLLAPFGNELLISIGINSPTGYQTQTVGPLVITSYEADDTGDDVTVTIDVADRSWSISRRQLKTAINIKQGYGIVQTLQALLAVPAASMPPFSTAFGPSAGTSSSANAYTAGQDPWAAITDQANGEAWEAAFNRYGNLHAMPLPDPALASPSWFYTDGSGSPQAAAGLRPLPMLSCTRTMDADQVFNDVVVVGAMAGNATQQAEVVDLNPQSATYVNGDFGDCPTYIQTGVATDNLEEVAQKTLAESLGQADILTVTCVNNLAVDVDDVVVVQRARLGIYGLLYVVDAYTIDRSPGGVMTLTLRRVVA